MTTRVSTGVRVGRALAAVMGCGAMVLPAGCGSDAEEVQPAAPAPVESSAKATAEPSEAGEGVEGAGGDSDEGADEGGAARKVDDVVLQEGGPATGEVDLEGMKHAAHGILAAYFGGLMNNSTHNMEALSSDRCEFCKRAVAEIEDYSGRGLSLSDDFSWNILELYSGPPMGGMEEHAALVRLSASKFRFVDEAGVLGDESEGGELRLFIGARLTERGWVVDEIVPLDEESFDLQMHGMEG